MSNDSGQPMKVLYISHMKEKTGWARAAIDNILALEAAGVDVVCRSIDLTGQSKTPQELIHLERKECHDATHCIQHLLPHHLVGTDNYEKNIAYFVSESPSTEFMDWNSYLQLVDELWVPNHTMQGNLIDEGFKASVVPHACDPIKYIKTYPSMNIREIDHTFKFYTICDFNDRKNIESIIRCFHAEFDKSEPVSLILKVNRYGKSEQWVKTEIERLCGNIKLRSRLYRGIENYHREVVIAGHSSEEHVMSLHQYGDCFLNFSYGEAWSIPTFDAMAFGNTPVVTRLAGTAQYIDDQKPDLGSLVDGQEMVCNSVDVAFPELLTARDTWISIDESDAMMRMRYYYENRKDRRSVGIKRAKEFSHQVVGNLMKELLND